MKLIYILWWTFQLIKATQQSFIVVRSKLKSIEITFINVTFTKNVMVFLFVHIQDGNFLFTSVTNVQQVNWTEMNWTVLFCVIIYYRLNSIIVSLFILLIIYQSVFDRVISRLSCLKPVAYIISVVSHIGVSE